MFLTCEAGIDDGTPLIGAGTGRNGALSAPARGAVATGEGGTRRARRQSRPARREGCGPGHPARPGGGGDPRAPRRPHLGTGHRTRGARRAAPPPVAVDRATVAVYDAG